MSTRFERGLHFIDTSGRVSSRGRGSEPVGGVYAGDEVGYGWDAPNRFVCPECVGDDYLWRGGGGMGSVKNKCEYCGGGPYGAGPVGRIVELVSPALHRYCSDPGSAGAIRDEGEWVLVDTIDTEQALKALWPNCGAELLRDVAGAFRNTEWVPCNGYLWERHESEQFTHIWHHFAQMARHRTRYFLERQPREYGEDPWMEYPSPAELLERIGELVVELSLIRPLEKEETLYRVRLEGESENFDTFRDLGPPPNEKAGAGRMNPAGIAYFYMARELGTAAGEVLIKPPARIAIGKFRTKERLKLLDLTDLPEPPSVFDVDQYNRYQGTLFLRDFVQRISEPVAKDGMEHVEYVPSQVVCEFFAQVFNRSDEKRRVNGIAYWSAVVPEGQNVILFPPEGGKRWEDLTELVGTRHVSMNDWLQVANLVEGRH